MCDEDLDPVPSLWTIWVGNRAIAGRFVTDGHAMIDLDQLRDPTALPILLQSHEVGNVLQEKCVNLWSTVMASPDKVPVALESIHEGSYPWALLRRADGLPTWVNGYKLLLVRAAVGDSTPMVQHGGVMSYIVFGSQAALLMPLRPSQCEDPATYPRIWPRPAQTHPEGA